MSSTALRLLLNRCVVDREFCELLLQRPVEIVKDYQLREAEYKALIQLKARTLLELVEKLNHLGLIGDYDK